MHAYSRMEADQSDSIAVCATKEEWQEVLLDLETLGDFDVLEQATVALGLALEAIGIEAV